MRKTVGIDVEKACREAWDGLWADNLRIREKHKDSPFRLPGTYYLTATDLERAIRRHVEAKLRGDTKVNWKEWRYGTWSTVRISIPGCRGGLMQAVRNWLYDQRCSGKLEEHNFGRGHISGARYRPAGEPIGPAEKETMERHEEERTRDYKANPLPVHAQGMLCTFTGGFRWRRGGGWRRRTTSKRNEITCKACLNLLAKPLTPVEQKRCTALEKQIEGWNRSGTRITDKMIERRKAARAELAPLAKRRNAMGWQQRMKKGG
jgi:hypothetical protein